MSTETLYAVDRIEGQTAVLIDEAGRALSLALALLPDGLEEGAILRVPRGADGAPEWPLARVDRAEAERRRAEARKALDELRKRDPGGDVEL